jgi:hypothetical protein
MVVSRETGVDTMSTEESRVPSDDAQVPTDEAGEEELEDLDVPEVAAESVKGGASKPAFGPW